MKGEINNSEYALMSSEQKIEASFFKELKRLNEKGNEVRQKSLEMERKCSNEGGLAFEGDIVAGPECFDEYMVAVNKVVKLGRERMSLIKSMREIIRNRRKASHNTGGENI